MGICTSKKSTLEQSLTEEFKNKRTKQEDEKVLNENTKMRFSTVPPSHCNPNQTFVGETNRKSTFTEYESVLEGTGDSENSRSKFTECVASFEVSSQNVNSGERIVSHLSWSQDGRKLATSLRNSSLVNISDPDKLYPDTESYIWSIEKNTANFVINSSNVYCLEFHPTDLNLLSGGLENGSIALFDPRRKKPILETASEFSHTERICDLRWYSEEKIVSISTGCQTVKIWDLRMLSKDLKINLQENVKLKISGCCLDVDSSNSSILVGTIATDGAFGTFSLRMDSLGKGPMFHADKESMFSSPVFSVERNPFFPKYFLSVEEKFTRIWKDGCAKQDVDFCFGHRENESVPDGEESFSFTSGCWSTTFENLFFTCSSDGYLDIWNSLDLFKPIQSIRFSSSGLGSIRANKDGIIAMGSNDGKIEVVRLKNHVSFNIESCFRECFEWKICDRFNEGIENIERIVANSASLSKNSKELEEEQYKLYCEAIETAKIHITDPKLSSEMIFETTYKRGKYFMNVGDFANAIVDFTCCLDLGQKYGNGNAKNSPQIQHLLTCCLLLLGDVDEALKRQLEYVKEKGSEARVYNFTILCVCLVACGERAEIKKWMDDAFRVFEMEKYGWYLSACQVLLENCKFPHFEAKKMIGDLAVAYLMARKEYPKDSEEEEKRREVLESVVMHRGMDWNIESFEHLGRDEMIEIKYFIVDVLKNIVRYREVKV